MEDVNYNPHFDDIYFSRADGCAESRYVFLRGNDLPARWEKRDSFSIFETGFGSGLNFLCAWQLFEETAPPDAVLDFISVERFPLSSAQVAALLSHWSGFFGGRLEKLIDQFPMRIPGFHRIHFGPHIRLTLIHDDACEALARLHVPRGIDAWFLDGHAPSKNPDMWNDTLYAHMARHSAPGATLATFTAVGAVRRGLQAAGFTVERIKGFGHKHHMTIGRFGQARAMPHTRPKRIAIIGGGLAGSACAFTLKRRGLEPVLFERENSIAPGASGNAVGLVNPRFSALRSAQSDFYAGGYALARRTMEGMADIGFTPCGTLHLLRDAVKRKRLQDAKTHWGWHEDHMRLVDAREASALAGVGIEDDALYLPDGFALSPHDLCTHYVRGVDMRLGLAPEIAYTDDEHFRVGGEIFDRLILCSGADLPAMRPDLPVHRVRGQVTYIETTAHMPRTALCYGGYIAPPVNNICAVGATFQKWLDDPHIRPEDDSANLDALSAILPGMEMRVSGSRVGFRCAARDHFPVISPAAEAGIYLSGAHGSHGLLSSLMGAEWIADQICGSVWSIGTDTARALDPARFLARDLRKNRL